MTQKKLTQFKEFKETLKRVAEIIGDSETLEELEQYDKISFKPLGIKEVRALLCFEKDRIIVIVSAEDLETLSSLDKFEIIVQSDNPLDSRGFIFRRGEGGIIK